MCCVREAEKSCGAAGTGISKNTHTNESDAATERAQRRKEENIKVQAAAESRGKAAAETTNIYEKYEQQTMCNIIEDDDVYTFQEKN